MERISHYQIVRRLGRGGMGEVYEAVDLNLGRHVALKFVAPEFAHDAEALRRFEREAQSAAALQHPHIATLYAFDRSTDRPFIAMELMSGESLRDRIIGGGSLPVGDALAIARDVATALAFAHRRGIIHRDIKPENLMFDRDGGVKITDFGLARALEQSRMTMTGTTMGTAAYMAPEAVRSSAKMAGAAAESGLPIGAPADVFALGVTLHETIAGALPFQADSPLALLYVIAHAPPVPLREARPDVDAEVADLVERMLAKDPASRPDALAAAQALGRMTGVSVILPPPARSSGPHAVVDTGSLTTPLESATQRMTQPLATAGAMVPTPITEELEVERRTASTTPDRPLVLRRTRRGATLTMVFAGLALAIVAGMWLVSRGSGAADARALALNNRGMEALRSGNAVSAESLFEAALARAPRYVEAKLNLATALQTADPDRASTLFAEVLKETPRRDMQAQAHYGLGEIDLNSQAWPSAVEHLREAARMDSTRPQFANNLGFALIQAGQTSEALDELRSAILRFPVEPTLHKNAALAWFRIGRYDSAMVAANRALILRPDYEAARELLASADSAAKAVR